ncbi:methyltransferase family protein [Lucifera butyrica]|nr:isoprenylcysteine carboxylmethyltransferase family protein [Lucifera butyrica]
MINTDSIVNYILRFNSGRPSPLKKRVVSLIIGATVFLIIFPGIFIFIGFFADRYLNLIWNPFLTKIIPIFCIPIGLFFLIWTTLTQWLLGNGTPAPNAPTQKLIVKGPYKYCRNPIQLGAIIYYLGIGTYFVSLTDGIVCFILGFIVGTTYHKVIEEKELELRFGAEYIEYKRRTPFLLPKIK